MKGKIQKYIVRLSFLMATLMSTATVYSQAEYVGELGLKGGVSFYNGDINSTSIFHDLGPSAGAFFGIRLNDYFGLRFDAGFASIKGDARDYPNNAMPVMNGEYGGSGSYLYQFKKTLIDIGVGARLNFFKFDYDQKDRHAKRHTPYIMLGASLAVLNEWTGRECRGGIEFGAGYKVKVAKRVNLGIEFIMHKTFADDLDRNGHNYLDDPYHIKSSKIKNNDYYSMCQAYVSFDLFKKKGACRYMRKK